MWRWIMTRLFPPVSPGGAAVRVESPAAVSQGPTARLDDDDEAEPDEAGPISGGAPKPPGMSIDALVERQIEEARRRGRFDHLPGAGKPLPDSDTYDPDWWIRRKLSEEGADVPLSPALELRRDLPGVLDGLKRLRSEARVRAELETLNARIRKVNAHHVAGPASNLMPLDVEAWVGEWRAARTDSEGPQG